MVAAAWFLLSSRIINLECDVAWYDLRCHRQALEALTMAFDVNFVAGHNESTSKVDVQTDLNVQLV